MVSLPLLAALLCAPLPGALGVFLVLRRQALLVDGLAHGLTPGMVLSHYIVGHHTGFSLLGIFFSGGFAFALSWFLNVIGERMKEDKTSFMAVFSLISISVAFLDHHHENAELNSSLISAISSYEFLGLLGLLVVLGTLFFVFYPVMIGECFDEDFTRSHGLKSPFLFFVAMALVLSSCVLGPVLAISLLILPALSVKTIFMYYFGLEKDQKNSLNFVRRSFFSIHQFCLWSGFLSTIGVAIGYFSNSSFGVVLSLIIFYGLLLIFFNKK